VSGLNEHGLPHWFVILLFLPGPVFVFILWTRTPKSRKESLWAVLMLVYLIGLYFAFR
jgi:hypothetical protein